MSRFAVSVDVPVLVPFRSDGAARQKNWEMIRAEVWGDSNLIVGEDNPEGAFNRSLALNRASDQAGDWDVVVIADADSFTDPHKVAEAVEVAKETRKLVFPFTGWFNVESDEIPSFMKTGQVEPRQNRKVNPLSNSALMVVPREVWNAVNGFDEHFVGWGYEDMAFIQAVKVLTGEPIRFPGYVYHMEHPRPPEDLPTPVKGPQFLYNENRFKSYRNCGLRSDMRNMVEGNRVTLETA